MNALDVARKQATTRVHQLLWTQLIETGTRNRDPIPLLADRIVNEVVRELVEAMRQEKAERVT